MREVGICYSALFSNYEELKDPLIITPGWRYICYTDQPLQSDVWQIIQVKPQPGEDPQRLARWYKIMHWVDWSKSIWVDASFTIDTDLNEWWDKHHLKSFSCAKHPLRDDYYEECMDCITGQRGDRVEVDNQMNEYLALGLPRRNGLIQSGILLRENTPEVIELCEAWWKELSIRSVRDQIAFYRVSIGFDYHSYYWDYRLGRDFIYSKHYNRR